MAAEDAQAHPTAIRHQNDGLLSMAREMEMGDDAPFVFLCECRDAFCIDYVKLTIAEYAERRKRGDILCRGHRARIAEGHAA